MSRETEPSIDAKFWQLTLEELFARLGSALSALSSVEAEARRARFRPKTTARRRRTDALSLLVRQWRQPVPGDKPLALEQR